MATKIGILTFDDFTDADLFLHWDLLNRVKLYGLSNNWNVKILGTKETHLSVSGLKVETHGQIDEVDSCNAVLLTSGKGTRNIVNNDSYLSRLNLDPTSQLLAAQCSGSLILGAKGLLQNKEVSAYPPITKHLIEYGANLQKKSLVVDGYLATASSCLSSVLLSSWLIEKLVDEDAKKIVLESIMPLSGFSDLNLF